jgi:hypothetical protein
MDRQLRLDRESFEQILATAWVLQQLQRRVASLGAGANYDTSQLLDLVEAQHAMQTGALSPDAALCRIVGLALKLVPAHGAGVWLFAGDAFVYRAGTGTASDDEGLRTAVLSGLEGGEPSDESHPDGDMAQGTPFKSLLVAPIHQGPKVVGAFAVFSENAHGFSARDVTTARLLTGLLAHAVDKASSARFEHIVSLERAVVLHVIEDLVPTLAGLASRKPRVLLSPAVPAASVEAQTAATLSLPSFVPGEAGNGTHAETLAALVEEVENFQGSDAPPRSELPWVAEESADLIEEMLAADLVQERRLTLESAPGQNLMIPASSALEAAVVGSTQAESEPVHETRNDPVIGILQPPTQEACDSGPTTQNRNDSGVSSVRILPVSPYQQPFRFRNRLVHIAALTNRFERAATKINVLLSAKRMTPAMKRSSAATALLIALAFVAVKRSVPRIQTEGAVIPSTTSVPGSETGLKIPEAGISHKRVTDSEIAAALREMSPFEIPGLRRQARYGDQSAALLLGMAYEVGHGLPQDCVKAAYWVGEAANGGNAAAAFNLGLRYRNGDGVPASLEESAKWLRKAATQNYPVAQIVLGTLTANQSHLSSLGQ